MGIGSGSKYCDKNLDVRSLRPSSTQPEADGSMYYCYAVPFVSFACPSGQLTLADSVNFESLSDVDEAAFCLDDVLLA